MSSSSYRSTFLASSHYAGKWVVPAEDQRFDLADVNELARVYAVLPDASEKEVKLLEIIEMFHVYLMKYLCMIVRGTIPPLGSRAGRDAKNFLDIQSGKNGVRSRIAPGSGGQRYVYLPRPETPPIELARIVIAHQPALLAA